MLRSTRGCRTRDGGIIRQGDQRPPPGHDRTVWFARGVGIVRDTTTVTSELKLPDGPRAKSLRVSTERLVEHRPSK